MKPRILLLSAILFSVQSHADTTLIYNDANGQQNSVMYMSDGVAKITNNSDVNTALIFNAQANAFTVVNHQDQSYVVFGEKEIAALSDVSAMVDRMLEEQLSQMPAAQRDQMRGMMESMIKKQMPKQAAPPQYNKSGQSSNYNGFDCEVVIKMVEGQKDGDFCVADIADLGIPAADYDSINQFMQTVEKLASQFGQDQSMNFSDIGSVIPVYYDMGLQKAYLTEINHDALGAQTFQVPEGYSKTNLGLPTEIIK